jgi:hypothetical protein
MRLGVALVGAGVGIANLVATQFGLGGLGFTGADNGGACNHSHILWGD